MSTIMSTSSGNKPPTFSAESMFNGTNYFSFKDQVVLVAKLKSVLGYLNGTIKNPSNATKSSPDESPENLIVDATLAPTKWWSTSLSLDKWEIHNAWALALIVYNTKNPVRLGLKMSRNVAEAWETLKKAYRTILDLRTNTANNAREHWTCGILWQ